MLPTCHPMGALHRVPAAGPGQLHGDPEPSEGGSCSDSSALLRHSQMDVKGVQVLIFYGV